MTVLIITRSDDHAGVPLVMSLVEARGHDVIRLDTDRYPTEARISAAVGASSSRTLRVDGRTWDLGSVDALWYRRFFAGGRLPASMGDLRDPSVNESRRTLYGTIAALGAYEVDPLSAVRTTDHKELQLRRAAALGLRVPATLFSNDPVEVRAFFHACGGRVVTKMQNSFAVYRDGKELVVFTTPVTEQDLDDLDGLALCPMTFQEHVPKRLELRATVVGRRVFTAAIDSQKTPRTQVDWRRDGVGLIRDWVPYRLDASVERALLELTRQFDLNYAAADFIITPDGETVFLEINAGGEWFWLQQAPGLPIAEAMADVLAGKAPRLARPA